MSFIRSHKVSFGDVTVNLCQYEGELKVLYQVTVISTLTSKKWASKDLPVKAGEELDVIMKAGNDKLICRNEEGKCKYLPLVVKKTHRNCFPVTKLTLPPIEPVNVCLSGPYSWLCFDQPHCHGVSTTSINTYTD